MLAVGPKQGWFITGAGRGLGLYIAQAARAAGHAVVATGRTLDNDDSFAFTYVETLALQPDGKVLVAGRYTPGSVAEFKRAERIVLW